MHSPVIQLCERAKLIVIVRNNDVLNTINTSHMYRV